VARLLAGDHPAVLVRRGGALAGIVTRYDMVRYLSR
jgi:predicted transcriptional regulator